MITSYDLTKFHHALVKEYVGYLLFAYCKRIGLSKAYLSNTAAVITHNRVQEDFSLCWNLEAYRVNTIKPSNSLRKRVKTNQIFASNVSMPIYPASFSHRM